MTFEEFFIKKKIDLVQLRRARPDLYEEFRGHYEQMGEKSFDHTKKYWFNRLRKDYLLTESVAVETKTTAATAVTSAPSSNTSTPDTEKNVSTPAVSPSDLPSTRPSGLSSMRPSGFKPRFKPGATKSASSTELVENKPTDEVPQKAAPPTGFKPRFKPGVTKPAAPTAPTKDSEQQKPNQLEKPAQTDEPKETPEQAPAKPAGFKPRFKPGITKPAAPSEPRRDSEQQKPDQQEPSAQTDVQKETPEQTPTKPLGFKPRFKPGIANKRNEDND